MRTTCLWLLACLAPLPAAADTIGRVSAVTSGDSLTVVVNEREQVRVRLVGIDAPEPYQDFARESRSSLGAYASGREVRLDMVGQDRQGRTRARVWAAEGSCSQPGCPKTLDLGLVQVAAGMAWHDPAQDKDVPAADRQRYGEAEFMAKARRLGLWAGKNPQPPWAVRQNRLEE